MDKDINTSIVKPYTKKRFKKTGNATTSFIKQSELLKTRETK